VRKRWNGHKEHKEIKEKIINYFEKKGVYNL